MQTINYTQSKA